MRWSTWAGIREVVLILCGVMIGADALEHALALGGCPICRKRRGWDP